MGVPAARMELQMKCKACAEARRFAEGCVMCVLYGIIISEEHNCDREGARPRGTDTDRSGNSEEQAGLYEDGSGDLVRLPGMVFRAGE